jgi:RNA polymerase sigma-70 factor (ECF subfamily)
MTFKKYDWQNKHQDWSDERLIESYLITNNAEFVATLFSRYADLIYGLCFKYLKDVQESEDTSYELFESLLTKLKNHTIISFKPWFYRTASNYCLDKLRKQKSSIVVPMDDKFVSDISDLDLNETNDKELLLAKIDTCLKTLNEDQRKCIDLFYFQEKSYQDISDDMNISWAMTRSFIQNGKRNLKICMEKR